MAEEATVETTEVTEPVAETTETTAEVIGLDAWRDSIKDVELRKVAERFDSPAAAVKAVADLRKRESTSIRIPGEGSTDEDRAAYRTALGVPDSTDGYDFAVPEGHEITEADTAFQSSAAELFHAQNITAEQAAGLNEWWNKMSANAVQAKADNDKTFAAATEAALKAEWPGDEFDRNKGFANLAATKLFEDTLDDVRNITTSDGNYVLDHPAFVKVLAQYGREISEGTLTPITEGDRDSVQGQIGELQTKIDKAQATGDRTAANKHYQEQQALYGRLNPGSLVGAEGRTV